MADSYVCSGAVMRCTFGTSTARLQVLPDRTVWLAGKLMGNISDHRPGANIPGFGRCRTVSYPPTGSATAANHGRLTPMPCLPSTIAPWLMGKMDYLIQGQPALLKSCRCMCQWGGVITITDDGQHAEGTQWVRKEGERDYKAKQKALNFYIAHAPERIGEADAIEWTKAVEEIDLPAGSKVYMYCAMSDNGEPIIGSYASPKVQNPSNSGILGYTEDGPKQLCEITLTQPMKALKSTAKIWNGDSTDRVNNVVDTWSVPLINGKATRGGISEGGGEQLFIPGLNKAPIKVRLIPDHETARMYEQ